jgi:3-hydroxyacyl-CoA dehydrogenase
MNVAEIMGTSDTDPDVLAAALKEQYIEKGKLGTTTGEGSYTY